MSEDVQLRCPTSEDVQLRCPMSEDYVCPTSEGVLLLLSHIRCFVTYVPCQMFCYVCLTSLDYSSICPTSEYVQLRKLHLRCSVAYTPSSHLSLSILHHYHTATISYKATESSWPQSTIQTQHATSLSDNTH